MKKKVYVQPSVSAYEMETESILAESEEATHVNASFGDGESEGVGYGGDTDKDKEYTPW